VRKRCSHPAQFDDLGAEKLSKFISPIEDIGKETAAIGKNDNANRWMHR
jgi:hypothetical protein